MPNLIVMVGPPGSGKSTYSQKLENYFRVFQDDQSAGHLILFKQALKDQVNVVVDRMGFSVQQRERYLKPAKEAGYTTKIVVLHENFATCFKRCNERKLHPTIKQVEDARKALNMFFCRYERPTEDEADIIEFRYPELTLNVNTVVIDIDNTLSDSSHRQHILDNNGGKKNWKGFFDAMGEDPVNEWCKRIANTFRHSSNSCIITLCSGRPDSYRKITEEWLSKHKINYDNLFMRDRSDSTPDTRVKELIMDFEIKTRYNILFWVDDRKCVIDKIRSRGIIVLDCAGEKGNF